MSTSECRDCVALIPARSGSKRVPNKNIRLLDGIPCMAHTINAARNADIFERIIVSTDSEDYADIAKQFGAEIPYLRPAQYSRSESPDIEWIHDIIKNFPKYEIKAKSVCILRPTSPFRKPESIKKAYEKFVKTKGADSLRAVEKVSQHPGKMWVMRSEFLLPLLPFVNDKSVPWHSSQTNTLPTIYVQNASLEFTWVDTVLKKNSIAGERVVPWIFDGNEGFDINTEEDWERAIQIVAKN